MFRYPPYILMTLCLLLCIFNASAADMSSRRGFTENKGQILDQSGMPNSLVIAASFHPEMDVLLYNDGFSYQIKRETPNQGDMQSGVDIHRVDIRFDGGNPRPLVTFSNAFPDEENFLTNESVGGIYGVRTFRHVLYHDIYEGIDLEFTIIAGKNGSPEVKFNFILDHAWLLSDIQMRYNGQEALELMPAGRNEHSQMAVSTSLGEIKESVPYSFLSQNAKEVPVDIRYKVMGNDLVTFECNDLGLLQSADKLVIDPTPSVTWSTYFGGTGSDQAWSVKLDGTGYLYMGGYTTSTSNIATAGAHQVTFGGGVVNDIFIARFDLNGNRQWCTYLGGAGDDQLYDIEVDASANAYFIGITGSTSSIATAGAHQSISGGLSDAVIGKIDPAGVIQWVTYFGGASNEAGFGITWDGTDLYTVGYTVSTSSVASAGAYQTAFGGGAMDGFLAKFSTSGVLAWSTYYGGNGSDVLRDVTTDSAGNILTTGNTSSASAIATAGAYQTTFAGVNDGILLSFTNTGLRQWATYFGGTQSDLLYGIGTNAADNIIVTGQSYSSNGIATTGAHDETAGGAGDAFMMIFDNAGFRSYGTYLGGTGSDIAYALKVDDADQIYIGGNTGSASGISTADAAQTVFGGGSVDGFLAQFSATGALNWGTYLGGTGSDYIRSAELDPVQGAFAVGFSNSSSAIATAGVYQTAIASAGVFDAFLTKFNSLSLMPVTILSFDAVPGWQQQTVECQWHVASELACTSYLIEKSMDATNWIEVGALDCTQPGGESTYGVTDHNPSSGLSYYRLSEIDISGVALQDRSVAVYLGDEAKWLVYPSPALDEVNMVISTGRETPYDVFIFNVAGQLISRFSHTGSGASQFFSLDISSLQSGIYYCRLVHANGDAEFRSFQKH